MNGETWKHLSNGMFSAFLSRDMTYSCAIYTELDRDLRVREAGEGEGRESTEQMNGGMGLKRIVNGTFGRREEGEDRDKVKKDKAGKDGAGEEVDELEEAQLRKLR